MGIISPKTVTCLIFVLNELFYFNSNILELYYIGGSQPHGFHHLNYSMLSNYCRLSFSAHIRFVRLKNRGFFGCSKSLVECLSVRYLV